MNVNQKSFTQDKFFFDNSGREKLLDQNNLSVKNITNKIKTLLK